MEILEIEKTFAHTWTRSGGIRTLTLSPTWLFTAAATTLLGSILDHEDLPQFTTNHPPMPSYFGEFSTSIAWKMWPCPFPFDRSSFISTLAWPQEAMVVSPTPESAERKTILFTGWQYQQKPQRDVYFPRTDNYYFRIKPGRSGLIVPNDYQCFRNTSFPHRIRGGNHDGLLGRRRSGPGTFNCRTYVHYN